MSLLVTGVGKAAMATMLPLDWLGYLKPILEWTGNAVVFIFVIGLLIVYSIGQSFNARFPRRNV